MSEVLRTIWTLLVVSCTVNVYEKLALRSYNELSYSKYIQDKCENSVNSSCRNISLDLFKIIHFIKLCKVYTDSLCISYLYTPRWKGISITNCIVCFPIHFHLLLLYCFFC